MESEKYTFTCVCGKWKSHDFPCNLSLASRCATCKRFVCDRCAGSSSLLRCFQCWDDTQKQKTVCHDGAAPEI